MNGSHDRHDDTPGIVRPVEEFRSRIVARRDPGFDAPIAAAVAEIRAARGTTQ